MRRGVYSRYCGYTVVVFELIMILIPISIISYMPKSFFGALLVFIAIDLLMEWLVTARDKLAEREYIVCLFTFISIQITGIDCDIIINTVI